MDAISGFVAGDGEYLLRLVLAMVLGGTIGLERQKRGRSAGLRTNILVCLGSAAIIIAFQKFYDVTDPGAESAIRMDPARAAAGVITGIGFLGAGTIVKSKNFVRGLTTAASIWVVSAVGVTIGLGEYLISVVLSLLVLLTLYLLHRLPVMADHYSRLSLTWTGDPGLLGEIAAQLASAGVDVKRRNITRRPGVGESRAVLSLKCRDESRLEDLVRGIQADERFDEVGWS